jgi:hypothetical protein
MAVHPGNKANKNTNRNTSTVVDDDDFGSIGGGRVNNLLGAHLSMADDSEGVLDIIHEAMSHICETTSNRRVQVKAFKFRSNEQTPDSRLAYPTVLLAVGIKNHVVIMPYFIVPGRTGDFDPMVIRNGPDTITLNRHPSEAYDGRAIADFNAVVSVEMNVPVTNIHPQDVKCIHDISVFVGGDPESIHREANRLLGVAIRIAASTLLVTYTGAAKDVSLVSSIAATSNLSINFKTLDTLKFDEDQQPVSGTFQATVRVESVNGDNTSSLNRSQGTYTVGSVMVRPSIVHAQGQGAFNPAFMPQGAVRPPMFTPQLILDDMTINGDPSPANTMLLLAATNPLINPEVIRRMFDPKDIGYLNTRANITGDGKPFAEKDVRASYPMVWNQFFTNSVVVSMSIRLGSLSALYGGMFLRDALNSVGKGESRAAIETLFDIDLSQLHNNVRSPGIELHPVGTYRAENGSTRPLSDIDLLWLIRHAANRPQLIDQWAMSSDGSRDPTTSLAMKINVLKTVTNNTVKVTDRALMISFSPDYLRVLATALNTSRVGIQTNIHSITGIEHTRWAPYMAAGQSLDFNQFVPFTGSTSTAGGYAYQYAGFSHVGQPPQQQGYTNQPGYAPGTGY